MITLGIDPAVVTGFAVVDNGKIAESYAYTSRQKTGFWSEVDRWLPYANEVEKLIDHYAPDIVVIEGYGYGNAHTLATLVELGTVLRQAVRTSAPKTPLVQVPPTTLKKFITGKGNSNKDKMLLEVYKRWGHEASDNNEADAIGLAYVGYHLTGYPLRLPKVNLDALQSVRKRYAEQLETLSN